MTNDVSSPSEDGDLAAGSLGTWFVGMLEVLDTRGAADVPCGACTACCTSRQFIHVEPDERETLAAIPAALLFPAPGSPVGLQVMGYDEQGRCPMLVEGACSIYPVRPRACRAYDCRILTATGVTPEADKPRIVAQVSRWSFGPAQPEDAQVEQAIAAARAHVQRGMETIDPALRPASANQAAVLTLQFARAFLVPAAGGSARFRALDEAHAHAALHEVIARLTSR